MTSRSAPRPPPGQDHVAGGDVVGVDVLGLGLHPVAGQVETDVGAGHLAVPPVAAPRVDGDHGDMPGRAQQGQGIVHRPGGQPARVPGHHRPLADRWVGADPGDDQHRAPYRQDQPVGHLRGHARILPLADDGDVAVAGMEGDPVHRVPLVRAPLVADAGALGGGLELAARLVGDLAGVVLLPPGDVRRDVGLHVGRHDRHGDDMQPHEVGVVPGGQRDRRLYSCRAGLAPVHVHQNVLQAMAASSVKRRRERSGRGPLAWR